MKKVAIIGSAGIPARYGGFETLVENLARHLAKKYQLTVYCSRSLYRKKRSSCHGARLVYFRLRSNGVQSILYDGISIIHAAFKSDILLILGVSGAVFLPLIKRLSRCKLVVHLDGVDWKREKWGALARRFLRFSESLATKYADALIADNVAIQDYIRKEFGKQSFVAEYGGDHAVADRSENLPFAAGQDSEIRNIFPRKARSDRVPEFSVAPFERYAISVCRIEPENNIHCILQSFSDAATLPLVIVGNWSSSAYGRSLRRQYDQRDGILLLDPIYDSENLYVLRSRACLYVHGHSAGGTNPSLVEAMYLGLPIIAMDVVYNRATTFDKALYFKDSFSLRNLLVEFNLVAARESGREMKNLAHVCYSWSSTIGKYDGLFNAVLNGGDLGSDYEAGPTATQIGLAQQLTEDEQQLVVDTLVRTGRWPVSALNTITQEYDSSSTR